MPHVLTPMSNYQAKINKKSAKHLELSFLGRRALSYNYTYYIHTLTVQRRRFLYIVVWWHYMCYSMTSTYINVWWWPLRWVHTCNITVYCNAVTLQVPDMIRSYELKFNPMPHGVTISCECYTLGFPVCYGCPSDVFAASSGFVHLYILCFKEKEKRAGCSYMSRCTSTPAQAVTVSSLWSDGQIPTAHRTSP